MISITSSNVLKIAQAEKCLFDSETLPTTEAQLYAAEIGSESYFHKTVVTFRTKFSTDHIILGPCLCNRNKIVWLGRKKHSQKKLKSDQKAISGGFSLFLKTVLLIRTVITVSKTVITIWTKSAVILHHIRIPYV